MSLYHITIDLCIMTIIIACIQEEMLSAKSACDRLTRDLYCPSVHCNYFKKLRIWARAEGCVWY